MQFDFPNNTGVGFLCENMIIYDYYPKKPKNHSEITLVRISWAGFP
jgi:hypothetical protein